jgi:pilus assembly protein CpaF
MSAVDTVEAEVRELVRRRGLDPIEDRAAVRRLVDEVIAEYDERPYDAVAGFGPLQRHLDDPTVEEICINERLTAG